MEVKVNIIINGEECSSDAAEKLTALKKRIATKRLALQHALEGKTNLREFQSKEVIMAKSNIDKAIEDLTAEVAQEATIIDSAVAYIKGVPALIQKAIDDAIANGVATPEQLKSMTDLVAVLDAKGAEMQAALQPPTA